MNTATLLWLFVTILCIVIQGFYSMLEMAAVSFNRVRLEYYLSKGMKKALWLQYLLERPTRLFGTVMLGVNVALQIGSQSSREFYASLNLDPDWAPLTQIFLVVLLAELAPLFAARKYAEHVVLLGIPLIYATYLLFYPLIWIVGILTRFFSFAIGNKKQRFDVFLTRDELQKVVESHEEGTWEGNEFNLIVANIFSLRNKNAAQVMKPLEGVVTIPSFTSIKQLKERISGTLIPVSYVPIYHKNLTHIIAIAFLRDLVKAPDNKAVRDFSRPPWFITQETKLLQIVKQFRSNNKSVAIVLNDSGAAVGILTLDAIFEEIFGEFELEISTQKVSNPFIERTFPGTIKVVDFNKEYGTSIDPRGVETLAHLMLTFFDHPPESGESVIIDGYEFTAIETTLLDIKTIAIKTVSAERHSL